MKTKRLQILLFFLSLIFLGACNVVEGPKVDPSGFSGSPNKILLEDFTGHLCGYCPRAHDRATDLLAIYPENIVVVAIHAGDLARTTNQFPREFRTAAGNLVYDYFLPQSLPTGLINRRKFGASPLTQDVDWGTHIGTVLSEVAKMKIDLASNYNSSTRELEIAANLEYFTEGNANHHIVVQITEDGIVSKQTDYRLPNPQYNEAYVHNHVLRAAVTEGDWGVAVKNGPIFLGEKIAKNFRFEVPQEFVPENCHVVAYVHDNISKEVLQAEEIKLVQ